MYMQSTIEVDSVFAAEFEATIKDIVRIQADNGWRLVSAFVQITGQFGVYVDTWEMPDASSYQLGMQRLREHPEFPKIFAVLSKAVKRETTVLGEPVSYSPR
jgi:hypothetical protein